MVMYPSLIRTMEVCPDCKDVVGLFHPLNGPGPNRGPLVQRGTCPLHKPGHFNPKWTGFDFNRYVDLCRCCARVPLASGSKWSVWFCVECKRRVGLLNGRHGRCIVPIGRHSVHYGYPLGVHEVGDAVSCQAFIDASKAMGVAIRVLTDWYHEAVRRNLDAVAPGDPDPMPIWMYCPEVARKVDPMERFREMCAYLDRRGRAMLEERERVDR